MIGDMPYMSDKLVLSKLLKMPAALCKAGCDAIKLEGGSNVVDIVEAQLETTIPVMGHIFNTSIHCYVRRF